MTETPFEFRIGLADFDASRLPAHARDKSTEAFKIAVATYFEEQLGHGGRVGVRFEPEAIHVKWIPAAGAADLSSYAVELLQRADYASAVPLLGSALATDPDDVIALYNLGMAYSDLGRFDEAKLYLERLVRLQPNNTNAVVALGVAYGRSGDRKAAEETLRRAVSSDPANGYAHRNLAAVLAGRGQLAEAESHFRRAVELLPKDQQSREGLAQCLEDLGKTDEADAVQVEGIALAPDSAIAERMREARSLIAQRAFKAKGVGGLRPDALMYCAGALEQFDAMSPEEVRRIGLEIATLGRGGLDVNDLAKKYSLSALPGEFSGLHLVCLMYVALKRTDPSLDPGFDLSAEYEAALALHKGKGR